MIRRAARPKSRFYRLDKRISEDERLSWAARGMLIFLLGKPDDWQISIPHLMRQTENARISTRRDATYALINELVDAGYVRRMQATGKAGHFAGVNYEVCEDFDAVETEREDAALAAEPDFEEEDLTPPHTPHPHTPHPDTGDPDALLSTEKVLSTEKTPSARARGVNVVELRLPSKGPAIGAPDHQWAALADSTEIDPHSMKGERYHCRGKYRIRVIAQAVAEAAGWHDHRFAPDWTPLLEWLDAGIDPHEVVLPTIRRMRERTREPINSLRFFARAIEHEANKRRRAVL